jgi:hypothetical protein
MPADRMRFGNKLGLHASLKEAGAEIPAPSQRKTLAQAVAEAAPPAAAKQDATLSFSKTQDSNFTPTPRAQATVAKAPTTNQAAKLVDTKTLPISTIDAYRRMTGKNEMPRYISSVELAKLTA